MTIQSGLKSVRKTLFKDPGISDETRCIGQLAWLLFLKMLEDRDSEYERLDPDYRSPLPKRFRWRQWARNGHPFGELPKFIDDKLFPYLRELPVDQGRDRRTAVIRSVFEGARNHVVDGELLEKVIDKIDQLDFNPSQDLLESAEAFESFLKELQEAGELGTSYTPRALTRLVVDRLDPHGGELILDPACSTGGYLVSALEYVREHYVESALDEAVLQRSVKGIEKHHVPHLLATMNMMLNGIDVPAHVEHDNPLSRPLATYNAKDRADVIATTLPLHETEEFVVQSIFPPDYRTRESSDLLFLAILHLLKPGGRAGLVMTDGLLTGEGVRKKLRRKLLEECDLHTIVRLPKGVLSPQSDIRLNLVFFQKGKSTREVWYYEQFHPEGYDCHTEDDPILLEHFQPLRDWWDDRKENQNAWRVTREEIAGRDFTLDFHHPQPPELSRHPTRLAEEEARKLPDSFLDFKLEDQIQELHGILLGQGAIERDEAIRQSAETLRAAGRLDFNRFRRDSQLAQTLEAIFDEAVLQGFFDRPWDGYLRAILPDASDYTLEDWLLCLLGSLGPEALERDEAIRGAADWAADNLGLRFKRLRRDGHAYLGLDEAIEEAVELGDVEIDDDDFVWRPEIEEEW